MEVAGTGLPGRYYRLMTAGIAPVEARLAAGPLGDLQALETQPGWRHFPSCLLVAAVLYATPHPANPRHGDHDLLALAVKVGDFLASESEKGQFRPRLDSHRDAYMWLEAYRLLEPEVDPDRRACWRREIQNQVRPLVEATAERQDFPRYQSPYISTSPNHYSLWASTVHLAGRVFGEPEWERLGARVLHRFATEEQAPDGYWGEHSSSGPTTGYNFLTLTGVALYWEHSRDRAALEALRRSTRFHEYYTFPDGTPVDVINDRNRYWGVSAWGHFGFTHFTDGRRYAEFLTGFLPEGEVSLEDLGRLAQNALYFHEGPTAPIPQEQDSYAHQMSVPAGIRKRGPWVVCLSGLISTQAVTNQFYLDRQGSLSVFHERLGLIVTGANSKRQPELATFSGKIGGQLFHMPISSALRMSEDGDRLALAYPRFFAELAVTANPASRLQLRFTVSGVGQPPEDAQLTLQLCLKGGEALETAAGKRFVLGAERLDLGPQELGGWILHNGWRLSVDPTGTGLAGDPRADRSARPSYVRLAWPVYPYNPYRSAPETSLVHAVGSLSMPLRFDPQPDRPVRADEQEILLTLDAE
jgi:hypothetical protein